MTVAPASISQIADDSRPAVTTAGEAASAPGSDTSAVVVLSNPVSLPPAPALAAPASSALGAAFSFDAYLIATWLLQPRASELPAMRKYASTFCVEADSAIHPAFCSTISNSIPSINEA